MSYWGVVGRFAWIVAFVLLVVGLIAVTMPKCRDFQNLQARKLALSDGNERLRAQGHELDEKQRKFRTDPEFVERVAREQGRVKPGETLYRVATPTNW